MTPAAGFTWSYSQLKNFETCAKRYYHYNIKKDVVEPETEQLREGNALHAAFDARIKRGTELPLGLTHHETLIARIIDAPGRTYSEQKLALTSGFKPVGYFGKGVWFRTVIDAAKVNGEVASVFDWKTGRPGEDITQLQLCAATMFHHMPKLQRVRSALVFVNYDYVEKAEFVREDVTEIWSEILPRVKKMEQARQEMEFPPRPGGLCRRYCAVNLCHFCGK